MSAWANFGVDMLKRAMELSETPIVVNQLSFSPLDRHVIDSGLYDFCRDNDVTIQAYRPLVESIEALAANKIAQAIAHDRNISIAQLAVAWICRMKESQSRRVQVRRSGGKKSLKQAKSCCQKTK